MFLLKCSILLAILLPCLTCRIEDTAADLQFGKPANHDGKIPDLDHSVFAGFKDQDGNITRPVDDPTERSQDISGRIVDIAQIENFPWQVSVQEFYYGYEERYHICGGFILNARWIGTAAHCVYYDADYPEWFAVFSGSSNLWDGGHVSSVHQIVVHRNYQEGNWRNDIAWMKLETDLDLNSGNMMALALPEPGLILKRQKVVVSGWGGIYSGGPRVSRLQSVGVRIVSRPKCKTAFNNMYGDGGREYLKTKTCAGLPNKNACYGDEGGALVMKTSHSSFVVGIASFVAMCGQDNFPGIYAEMSTFSDLTACVISK